MGTDLEETGSIVWFINKNLRLGVTGDQYLSGQSSMQKFTYATYSHSSICYGIKMRFHLHIDYKEGSHHLVSHACGLDRGLFHQIFLPPILESYLAHSSICQKDFAQKRLYKLPIEALQSLSSV